MEIILLSKRQDENNTIGKTTLIIFFNEARMIENGSE